MLRRSAVCLLLLAVCAAAGRPGRAVGADRARAAVGQEAVPAVPGPVDPAAARLEALSEELQRDARTPRGIVPLAGIAALAEDAPDLARVAAAYAKVVDDRGANPEVRALARFRLAGVERARGNLQKMSAQLRRLGFVTSWKIAGPFDDEGKRGFAEAYPPEQGIELTATMPGKVREVAW